MRYAAPVTVEQLLSTVRATGYGAEVVEARRPAARTSRHADHPESHLDHRVAPEDALKRRALVAAVLTVPVVVLAMVPGLDLPGSPWIQLVLATPVVLWCAWPFHRAAFLNARHGASTMDTLVSIGVLTAYLWSAVVVLTGRAAGMCGMDAGDVTTAHIWFETATVVTTFLLFGRWMEARATDRTRDALRGLLSLGAKDVAVERVDPTTRATTEVRIPVDDLAVGDRFVVRPGEKVATDGRVVEGSSAVDASLVTGESLPVDVTPGDELTGGSDQQHRAPGGRGDPGRRRHHAGRHRPAGRARPDHQGTGAAPRRPGLRRLRAGRARAGRADLRRLVGRHRRPVARARGGHRRARHRVPLRAGPGHPDRAAGGHRSRRAARHPDQGSRRARGHPPDRRRRARQDGHRDHRRDDPGRRQRPPAGCPRTRRCAPPPPSRPAASTPSPAPSSPPPRAAASSCRGPPTSWRCPAPGPGPGSRAPRSPSAEPTCSTTCPASWPGPRPTAPRCGSAGTAAPTPRSPSPTPCAAARARHPRPHRGRAARLPAHRRPRRRRARPWPARSASRSAGCSPTCGPRTSTR